jgi:chromosome segregation ATPase
MTAKTAAVLTGIITFSKAAQSMVERFAREEQDEIVEYVAKRLAQHMDVPPVYAVVHRDESAIHVQLTMLNVTSTGRTYRGNRAAMSKLQDIAAAAFQKRGLYVSRGKRKVERIKAGEKPDKYVNKSVAQLHETLPADIAKEEQHLAEVREKIHRAEIEFDDMDQLIFKTKFKIKEGEDELEKVEQRRVTAEEAITSLERQRNALAEKVKTTEERLAKAEQKLQALDGENERLLKRSQTYAQRLQNQRKATKDVEDRLTLLAENQRLQAANKDLQQRLLRYERGRGQRGPGR